MKTTFTITVLAESEISMLGRISSVFNRRRIGLERFSAYFDPIRKLNHYELMVRESPEQVERVVKQLEKQVDVISAHYIPDGDPAIQDNRFSGNRMSANIPESNTQIHSFKSL